MGPNIITSHEPPLCASSSGTPVRQARQFDTIAMRSQSNIVAGGGWMTRQTMGRPKARFFGFLSVIWLSVFLGASCVNATPLRSLAARL